MGYVWPFGGQKVGVRPNFADLKSILSLPILSFLDYRQNVDFNQLLCCTLEKAVRVRKMPCDRS